MNSRRGGRRGAGPSNSNSGPIKRKIADLTDFQTDEDPKQQQQQPNEPKPKSKKSQQQQKFEELKSSPSRSTTGNGDPPHQPPGLLSVGLGAGAEKVMRNELVLGAIGRKLPIRNCLPLRQTCTLWKRTFSSTIAARHSLIELHTDPNRQVSTGSRPSWLISDFTNAMQPNAGAVGGYYISDLGLGRQRDLKHFFDVFGKTISRLGLGLDRLNGAPVNIARQIVFDWTPELTELTISAEKHNESEAKWNRQRMPPMPPKIPKLRKLTIIAEELNRGCRPYLALIQDLFMSAVGLECLSLEKWFSAGILQALGRDSSHFPAVGQLKQLKVGNVRADQLRQLIQLASLRENPLRLTELNIAIVCDYDEEEQEATDAEIIDLTYRLLATQAATLHALDISVYGLRVINDIIGKATRVNLLLPRMENVRSLTLYRDANWTFTALYEERTFMDNFPKLKILELSNWTGLNWLLGPYLEEDTEGPGGMTRVVINQLAHDGVTSLKFGLQGHEEEVDETGVPLSLVTLPQIWPSISKLELELRSEVFNLFNSFWSLWPGLISLRVKMTWSFPRPYTSTLGLDELMSGIPASKFATLKRQLGSVQSLTIGNLRALQTKYRMNAGISNLVKLQEFVLDCGQHLCNITDIGGYFGLAMMSSQSVQHVALIHDGERGEENGQHKECTGNQISEECRRFMRSVFGPCAVLDV